MEFDLRFTEVGYELMMLEQYAKLLRTNLAAIVQAEKKRVWDELDPDDEADRSVGHHFEDRLDEGITTRFLTGALLIATWAIYEATVQQMADYVRNAREVVLRMSHLKGSLLERARRYFDDVLRVDLHSVGTDWVRLERLAELRHIMAHANGRISDIAPDHWRRVEPWVKATPGVTVIDDEYLVLSIDFVTESLKFVDGLLHDLVGRIRRDFK